MFCSLNEIMLLHCLLRDTCVISIRRIICWRKIILNSHFCQCKRPFWEWMPNPSSFAYLCFYGWILVGAAVHQACFKHRAEELARSFGRIVHNNETMPGNFCGFRSLRCVPEGPPYMSPMTWTNEFGCAHMAVSSNSCAYSWVQKAQCMQCMNTMCSLVCGFFF